MRMTTMFALSAAFALSMGAVAIAQTTSNPPGTAAGRALDRAAGTDTSGAYPSQADGTKNNPRGTVASRTAHRVKRKAAAATHD